jgi:hypothetical protein
VEYLDNKKVDLIQFPFLKSALDENPGISDTFKTEIKKEYVGLWKKRFIDGLWVLAEGAIYDFFDDKKHSAKLYRIKQNFKPDFFAVGVDYGTGGVTCFVLFAIVTHPQ